MPLVNNVALSINWIPQSYKRLNVSSSPLSLFHVQVFCKLHQESFQHLSQRGRHRCNYTTTEFSSVICSYAPKYLHHKCSCHCTSQSTTLLLKEKQYFIRNSSLESVFAEISGLNLKTRGLVRKFKQPQDNLQLFKCLTSYILRQHFP